jgi:hypothetical protein
MRKPGNLPTMPASAATTPYPPETARSLNGVDRVTKREANRLPHSTQHPAMTEAEYRELIQKFVDRARADQSIAERLAEEAHQRFGAEIDVPTEPE